MAEIGRSLSGRFRPKADLRTLDGGRMTEAGKFLDRVHQSVKGTGCLCRIRAKKMQELKAQVAAREPHI